MNPPNSETPRTDALDNAIKEMELSTVYALHQSPCKCPRCVVVTAAKRALQLEKELNEANDKLENYEYPKLIGVNQQLTSRLEASERANSEMREALKRVDRITKKRVEFLAPTDYVFIQTICDIALSSTSGQSYIPREVEEKMYEALDTALDNLRQLMSVAHSHNIVSPYGRYAINMTKEALQLAQSYGLGKDKQNEKETK